MDQIEYKLVLTNVGGGLEKAVNDLMKEGFVPWYGPFFGNGHFGQALTRRTSDYHKKKTKTKVS